MATTQEGKIIELLQRLVEIEEAGLELNRATTEKWESERTEEVAYRKSRREIREQMDAAYLKCHQNQQ